MRDEFDFRLFGWLMLISLLAIATSIVMVYLEDSLVFYYFGFIAFYTMINLTLFSILSELVSSTLKLRTVSLKIVWAVAIMISVLSALEDIAHRCGLSIMWLQHCK